MWSPWGQPFVQLQFALMTTYHWLSSASTFALRSRSSTPWLTAGIFTSVASGGPRCESRYRQWWCVDPHQHSCYRWHPGAIDGSSHWCNEYHHWWCAIVDVNFEVWCLCIYSFMLSNLLTLVLTRASWRWRQVRGRLFVLVQVYTFESSHVSVYSWLLAMT